MNDLDFQSAIVIEPIELSKRIENLDARKEGTFELHNFHFPIVQVRKMLKTFDSLFSFELILFILNDSQAELKFHYPKGHVYFLSCEPDTIETREKALEKEKWIKEQKEKDKEYKRNMIRVKKEERLGDLNNSYKVVSDEIHAHYSGKTKLTERKISSLIKKQKKLSEQIEKQKEKIK